jgi:hypothetical protein
METFTGYIYKLTGACGKVYIGSTVDTVEREKQHKKPSNTCTNSKLLLKPIEFDIIDTREYILIKSLRLVEQFYLDNINNINSNRAYSNKKIKKKLRKKYYLANKGKSREYYENNKEKLREYSREYQRLYKERNKEKIREYQRLYRERRKMMK